MMITGPRLNDPVSAITSRNVVKVTATMTFRDGAVLGVASLRDVATIAIEEASARTDSAV